MGRIFACKALNISTYVFWGIFSCNRSNSGNFKVYTNLFDKILTYFKI